MCLCVQLLQLTNCADTVVGDGMIRGVSGGEKKRVTTGEVVVGPSKVLLMDEISTGALSNTPVVSHARVSTASSVPTVCGIICVHVTCNSPT